MKKQIIYNDGNVVFSKHYDSNEIFTIFEDKEYLLFIDDNDNEEILVPNIDNLLKLYSNMLNTVLVKDNVIELQCFFNHYYNSSSSVNELDSLLSYFEIETYHSGVFLKSYKGTSLEFEGFNTIEDFILSIKDLNNFQLVDLLESQNKKGI